MAAVTYSNTYENRFWLQMIGDYARLLLRAVLPEDTKEIEQIKSFISQFDNLLERARQNLTAEQIVQLNKDAYAATQSVYHYFISILGKQIINAYPLQLKPSSVNNAISFSGEYLYLLRNFMNDQQPEFDSAAQDVFWLPVFATIARNISDNLGAYQTDLRRRSDIYASDFQDLSAFATELRGLYRVGSYNFPIAKEHRRKVENELRNFSSFLSESILMNQQSRIPGTLTVLNADLTLRLVCYYLTKLTVLYETQRPACDPLRPRLSNI